jgi:hypothetical protein
MFSKLSRFKNCEKFTLDLPEKNLLVRNMWKVETRPNSVSDFILQFTAHQLLPLMSPRGAGLISFIKKDEKEKNGTG